VAGELGFLWAMACKLGGRQFYKLQVNDPCKICWALDKDTLSSFCSAKTGYSFVNIKHYEIWKQILRCVRRKINYRNRPTPNEFYILLGQVFVLLLGSPSVNLEYCSQIVRREVHPIKAKCCTCKFAANEYQFCSQSN